MTMSTKDLVEVTVSPGGRRMPIGLMTIGQALSLPNDIEFEASHPDHEAGSTDVFVSREALNNHWERLSAIPPAKR